MANNKTKKVVIKGVTEEMFQDSFQEFAQQDAKQSSILAKLDEKFAELRRKSEDELNDIKEKKEAAQEIIQVYCMEHPELFEKKKSFVSLHGTVGYRTGTPKLKNLKGFTWASITNLLKQFLPDYVRTVEEPAKDMILANRDTINDADLKKVGVEIVQDETFYIDLKKEEIAV
jgi:phage host-nuclease inhibitor protein Gam